MHRTPTYTAKLSPAVLRDARLTAFLEQPRLWAAIIHCRVGRAHWGVLRQAGNLAYAHWSVCPA